MTHTTLYYNPSLGNMEITVKVAIEDLERSIQNNSSEKMRIGTEKENQMVDKLIPNYFNQNLNFLINNETIGYESVINSLYINIKINRASLF